MLVDTTSDSATGRKKEKVSYPVDSPSKTTKSGAMDDEPCESEEVGVS